jgi:germacradienol/geosmin synthase
MPVDLGAAPAPLDALERGLADLWARTAGPMPAEARHAFRRSVATMLEGWLWELRNQHQNRIPDPVDYIEMRRWAFGADLTMSLNRLSHGQTVPEEIYRTRTIRNMENSAADYACLLNDLFSYRKEIEYGGELHNCVLVVQNFLDCDMNRAMGVVSDLMTARMCQFEHTVDVELPALVSDRGLDSDARATLNRYAAELKDWMAGILNWHRRTGRYDEAELRRGVVTGAAAATFLGPHGLGTSGARPRRQAPTDASRVPAPLTGGRSVGRAG